jgi:flavodoxin
MQFVIVYTSTFGNGKKVVERLTQTLTNKGNPATLLQTATANPASLPAADLYVFSAPAEAFNVKKDMRTLMQGLQGTEGKPYAIINTHAMKKNRLGKMEKLLSKKGMVKRADLEFQVSGDTKHGNGLPASWETKVDELAAKLTQ